MNPISNKREPGSGSEYKVLKSVLSIKEIRLLDIIGKGIAITCNVAIIHYERCVGEFINMQCMNAFVGEFSFVYKAHLLTPLVMQNSTVNNHEGMTSYSPLESIPADNIVAVKALKGKHNQTAVSPLGRSRVDQYSI